MISQSLATQFPDAQIMDLQLVDTDHTLKVNVTLRTADSITEEDVEQAETLILADLEEPVQLFVVVQQVITAPELTPESEITPEASPEMTPEATAEAG